MVSLLRKLPKDSPLRLAHPVCVASKIYKYYNGHPPADVPIEIIKKAAKACLDEGKYHGVAKMFKAFKGGLTIRKEIL